VLIKHISFDYHNVWNSIKSAYEWYTFSAFTLLPGGVMKGICRKKNSHSSLNIQKKKSTDHKSRVPQPTYIYTSVSTVVLQVNLD